MQATNFDVKSMTLIGKGERSKIYQHPTDSDKVVKVTTSKEEKAVLQAMVEQPRAWFAKVYTLEIVGKTMYAVIEKVYDADDVLRFETIPGTYSSFYFYESAYMPGGHGLEHLMYKNADTSEIASYIEKRIAQVKAKRRDIEEYYSLLVQAHKDGYWIPDTAWNLGKRADGSLCCYDTSFMKAWKI